MCAIDRCGFVNCLRWWLLLNNAMYHWQLTSGYIACTFFSFYCMVGMFGSDNVWQNWFDKGFGKKVWWISVQPNNCIMYMWCLDGFSLLSSAHLPNSSNFPTPNIPAIRYSNPLGHNLIFCSCQSYSVIRTIDSTLLGSTFLQPFVLHPTKQCWH